MLLVAIVWGERGYSLTPYFKLYEYVWHLRVRIFKSFWSEEISGYISILTILGLT